MCAPRVADGAADQKQGVNANRGVKNAKLRQAEPTRRVPADAAQPESRRHAPLSRIHSILGKNVTMHDGAVKQIAAQLEALLDNGLAGAPAARARAARRLAADRVGAQLQSARTNSGPYGGVGVVGVLDGAAVEVD